MLLNSQMKEGRFLRWHRARVLVGKIRAALAEGRMVQVTTYTRATRYSRVHLDWFEARPSGAYVRDRKGWACIDFCSVKAF